MAIPESQLDTWAKQGSISQSQATYATVRSCLEANDAPYANRQYGIFLQGSYGNDTNIYADSDVDVVIVTDSIYYYDNNGLPDEDKRAFNAAFSVGTYTYNDFKAGVTSQLTKKFGSSVKPGKKAIYVEGSGSRRDADVLPAVEHRRYTRFKSAIDYTYHKGICFWTSDGTKIINYPKQHSDNCTTKHQRTNSRFKPCVRILKNMRNSMIDSGYLQVDIAPSYFLEGMLYNVPDNQFSTSNQTSIVNATNWLIKCDRSKLLCANEQYYLIHPSDPVTWRAEKLQAYLDAVIKFWNAW